MILDLIFRTKLLPCPHDGRPARRGRDGGDRYTVRCSRCTFAIAAFTERGAGEKWNDRVTEVSRYLATESATDNQFAFLKHRADVRNCCKNPDNLEVTRLQPDLLRAVCKKCGTGHRKLKCEPAAFALSFR